jgi:hypothetical protein
VALAAVTSVLLLGACGRGQPLVDNLVEGMQEQEVLQAMHPPKGAFHVVAETSLRKGDPRPPYSVKIIRAEGVLCAGQTSDVSLSFYLKKLHVVSCYPKNVDAMIDALLKAGYITTRGREFNVQREGVAISSTEIDGRWCVSFSSERLTADQRRWNLRYS